MDFIIELILEFLFEPLGALLEFVFEKVNGVPGKGRRICLRILLISIPLALLLVVCLLLWLLFSKN